MIELGRNRKGTCETSNNETRESVKTCLIRSVRNEKKIPNENSKFSRQ